MAVSPTTTPGVAARPIDGLVEIGGIGYYAVPDIDRMPPFLISIVSDGDRWMFVSSTGALTAGRGNAAGALFPYETEDRIHDAAGVAGPATAVCVGSRKGVWTPFSGTPGDTVRRNLYKSVVGDTIIFEEHVLDLRLTFRYRWASCDRFGFVRTSSITNDGDRAVRADLVDGLLHLLPSGLDPAVYQRMSSLTNAYKRSEVIHAPGRLAVYSLESQVVDRPEPAEVLRASVAWSIGLDGAQVSVSPDMLTEFCNGLPPRGSTLLTGRRGAYLLRHTVDLEPGEAAEWRIVADVAQDQLDVAQLRRLLETGDDLAATLDASLHAASGELVGIMAPADALQRTGDRVATAHQFSNVTYNVMRGGVPRAGYQIASEDWAQFLTDRNRRVAERHREWIDSLPSIVEHGALLDDIAGRGDPHLIRLALEYLPFSFSRRHGDPSRPWNTFSIQLQDDDGRPLIYYEGNWRDIFQNWEALCMSFPEYLPGVVSVFVNASTADGFNPYRITRNGIDWEIPEPENPWSNIGYWGDHQIVYLLRLLEAADRFLPGRVEGMLGERWFSYADVPYRLAPYEDLVRDPKTTITYDDEAAARSAARVESVGGDGKLLWDGTGEIRLVTLTEKLLVAALAKLSNLVPGGGIWMNTQRPEWNDANNALVGFGLSMVTLFHLRRFLDHVRRLIRRAGSTEISLSVEVAEWLAGVSDALADLSLDQMTDEARKTAMDRLGTAFAEYRSRVYSGGFSGFAEVPCAAITALCDVAIDRLDASIAGARRPDGLYHSYNLVRFSADGSAASLEHLEEMLEGQVAVLDSRVLSAAERADVVDALFTSSLYRDDQRSFILYPAKQLPSFLDKNVIPPDAVAGNPLLTALLESGESSIVAADVDGRVRFHPGFSNRTKVAEALDDLAGDPTWSDLVAEHRDAVLAAYEDVFNHHAFTGRSGSMYGYEGIGSIYWHMVAKLLVAVQESLVEAADTGAPPATIGRLVDAYWRVRSGLGFNKTAREFGAIPIDPYSHTPAHSGAQQPGMTGLVKEELLTRPLEVGVRIADGEIRFDPVLVREEELLAEPEAWQVYDIDLTPSTITVPAGALGATVCQVPVIISRTDGEEHVELVFGDGTMQRVAGLRVDRLTSSAVFARTGAVARIHARLPAETAGPD